MQHAESREFDHSKGLTTTSQAAVNEPLRLIDCINQDVEEMASAAGAQYRAADADGHNNGRTIPRDNP